MSHLLVVTAFYKVDSLDTKLLGSTLSNSNLLPPSRLFLPRLEWNRKLLEWQKPWLMVCSEAAIGRRKGIARSTDSKKNPQSFQDWIWSSQYGWSTIADSSHLRTTLCRQSPIQSQETVDDPLNNLCLQDHSRCPCFDWDPDTSPQPKWRLCLCLKSLPEGNCLVTPQKYLRTPLARQNQNLTCDPWTEAQN